MRIRIMLVLCAVLALAAAVTSATAGGPSVDPAYYQGHEVSLLIPSSASANENQFVSGCFNLGPQQNWPDPASTLYTLFVPGATGHSCPNGSFLHDHVVSSAPGDPGYTGAWRVVRVTPGPNFAVSKMPYTSEAAVLAGAAARELVLTDTGASIRASVVFGR